MYNSTIGSFNVTRVHPDTPVTVRVWTNAPLETTAAANWLNSLVKGGTGVGDISNITVVNEALVIEMNPFVTTDHEALVATDRFLHGLASAAELLTPEDLDSFKHAEKDLLEALASSSNDSLSYVTERWT